MMRARVCAALATAFVVAALAAGCSSGASGSGASVASDGGASSSDVAALQQATVNDTPRSATAESAENSQLNEQLSAVAQKYSGTYSVVCQAADGSWKGSFDGSDRHVAASMVKLAIMGTLFDQESKGAVNLSDSVTLQASDIVGGTGVIGSQGAGSTWTYHELLEHMIQDSDNTATNVLIDKLGMSTVNTWASSFGLKETQLNRQMMDLDSGVENYMSAEDAAKILKAIWNGNFVSASASKDALAILEGQNETTGLEAGLPAGATFAHKTGTLDNVLNDGGIVETSKPFIIVVMASEVSSSEATQAMQEFAQVASDFAAS